MLTHKPVVFPIDEVLEVVESCCYAFESKNITANKQGTSKIAIYIYIKKKGNVLLQKYKE